MSGREKRSSLRRANLEQKRARMGIPVAGAAEAKAEERRVVTVKEKVKGKEKKVKERIPGEATGFKTSGPPEKVREPTMAGEDNPVSGANNNSKVQIIIGASPARAKVTAEAERLNSSNNSSSMITEVGTSQ